MKGIRTGEFWRRTGLVLAAIGLALTLPAFAQEDDASGDGTPKPLDRSQRVVFEIGSWVAQPAGLEYGPATRFDTSNVFSSEILQLRHSTEGETRWRLAYRFPKRGSELSLSYYSHLTGSTDGRSTPGIFQFGERLAAPAFAGYALDGLADAWSATSATKLRDARLEYRQRLFTSDTGVELTGSVGWARVWHIREQSAVYSALIPDIPPLLPPVSNPRPSLVPKPDSAELASRFEGRGMTGALEMTVPLMSDRLLLEASADLTILRGETNSFYASETHYFTFDGDLLEPPYDVFGEVVESPPGTGVFVPLADQIDQVTVQAGQRADRVPTTADVQGLTLGFRWRAIDWLDVFGGFRSARYTDVGIDLLPGPLAADVNTAQDYRRENRSATYEGFYVGVAFYVF